MNLFKRALIVGTLLVAGAVTDGLLPGQAEAIVGRPLTPVSCAGVARRTTRRMIYWTPVRVSTLPAGYTIVVIEGVTLYQVGDTYYQASGNEYVVVTVS
jgi:hypothetical protein